MVAVSVSRAGARDASTVTVVDSTPRASFTLIAFGCSGINCRFSRTCFWKPFISTVNEKWSGGRALKLKTPVSLLVLTTVSLVDKFLSVRVAPGTTAPSGSVTTPWIEVRNCANAGVSEAEKIATKTMAQSRAPAPQKPPNGALKVGIDNHAGILSKAVKRLIALSPQPEVLSGPGCLPHEG